MDGVHADVLVVLVEFDAAGDAGEILRRRERIADRLGILAAAANDVCNQKNLIIRVRIEVRGSRLSVGSNCTMRT